MYTLTSSAKEGRDPKSWKFEGSTDGVRRVAQDERRGEAFPWPRQTRAFGVAHQGKYVHYGGVRNMSMHRKALHCQMWSGLA